MGSEHSESGEGPGVKWDSWNRPVGYIIGVTPGFAQFEQGEQKLANMGLARKIMKAARLGFDFTEIDYEALSEMYEPEIERQIKHVKEAQRMQVGIHLPTKVDLCIANSFEWKEMHEILRKGAFSAKEVVCAKFFLFHTSSRIRPHVTFTVGHQEPAVQQNSFSGVNLGQWINQVDNGEFKDPKTEKTMALDEKGKLRDWFMARFVKVLFHVMGTAGDVGVITYFDALPSFKRGAEKAGIEFFAMRQKVWIEHVRDELLKNYSDTIAEKDNEMQGRIDYFNRLFSGKGLAGEDLRLAVSQALRGDGEFNQAQQTRARADAAIGDIHRTTYEKDIDSRVVYGKEELMEIWLNEGLPPEKALQNLSETYKKYQTYRHIMQYLQSADFNKVFDFWVTKGSECEEQVAYRVTAKYMFWIKDPLWTDIVGAKYDPDKIIKCADESVPYYRDDIFDIAAGGAKSLIKKSGEKPNEKERIKDLVNKMITAVACKYIQGHLFTEGNLLGMRGEFPEMKHLKDESVYKYTRNANIQIYIETSMPPEGQEGELRIMSAHDSVMLVKHLDNGEFTSYTMDFEHLTVNFVVVDDDIASLKDGDGKFIRMMHINAPRPIIGAHAPLEVLSHDIFIIYNWLYKLRKKGMKNAYFIWEMGSYGIQRSAIAFRNITDELSKETDPKKLPAKFYGIDETLWAAQHNAIREHGLDPLKGLFTVPEIDHGLFSKAAHEKGKAREWEEEKYTY